MVFVCFSQNEYHIIITTLSMEKEIIEILNILLQKPNSNNILMAYRELLNRDLPIKDFSDLANFKSSSLRTQHLTKMESKGIIERKIKWEREYIKNRNILFTNKGRLFFQKLFEFEARYLKGIT